MQCKQSVQQLPFHPTPSLLSANLLCVSNLVLSMWYLLKKMKKSSFSLLHLEDAHINFIECMGLGCWNTCSILTFFAYPLTKILSFFVSCRFSCLYSKFFSVIKTLSSYSWKDATLDKVGVFSVAARNTTQRKKVYCKSSLRKILENHQTYPKH